jgi:hypothetical protein
MESYHTKMQDLFAQLGLPNEQKSIEDYIQKHKGLAPRTHIEDAVFWTPQQADFIKEALIEDAEWAELIDQLNALLR